MTTKTRNPYAIRRRLSPLERAALKPPTGESVSRWAEANVVLPSDQAHPGRWRNDFNPYTVEVMDAWNDPRARVIVLVWAPQTGKTATMLNCLGFTADEDPGPVLWVMPAKEGAEEFMADRIKPSIQASPRLRALTSGAKKDWKRLTLKVGGLKLRLAGSNSAAGLAGDSRRVLVCDELDKFAKRAGRESAPLQLARKRLIAFADAREILSSTPTYTDGPIWEEWEKTDQRHFHVRCPSCSRFQVLVFERERLVWPEGKSPTEIESDRLAVYVCEHCEHRIPDDDETKAALLRSGVWVQEGAEIDDETGVITGEIESNRWGFHLNALYSPMPGMTWSHVAATFLLAKDEPKLLLDFFNGYLALPWQQRTRAVSFEHVEGLASTHEQGTVPEEVVVLTAGVDVQLDWLYYTVRGWGLGERSFLITAGRVETWDALEQVLFFAAFPRAGEDAKGEVLPLRLAVFDYQYRKAEVLRLVERHPLVARACRGRQHQTIPIQAVKNPKRDDSGTARREALPVRLWSLDVSYYKDKVQQFMNTERGAPGCWLLHRDPSQEYLLQVTSEHRTLVTDSKGTPSEEWVKRPGAGGNHWWDCEVYASAAADMLQVFALRDESTPSSAFVESLRIPPAPTDDDEKRKPRGRIRRGPRGGRIRRRDK